MKDYGKPYDKSSKEYTVEEMADFVMVPEKLSGEEEELVREEFIWLRMKKHQDMFEKDRLLSGLLSIKYQI